MNHELELELQFFFLFGFENRLCQPRNALKLTLPQEYESLVESSQQYQHLDNPVYRVCIERAANAGVKDDLEIYPSSGLILFRVHEGPLCRRPLNIHCI